jgi:hypothetical protein
MNGRLAGAAASSPKLLPPTIEAARLQSSPTAHPNRVPQIEAER